jgi:hypothetical protein
LYLSCPCKLMVVVVVVVVGGGHRQPTPQKTSPRPW